MAHSKATAQQNPGPGYQFTHNSDVHARSIFRNAFLENSKVDRTKTFLPWTTYTEPEISHVGKYAHELQQEEFDTYTKFYERLDRAHCEGKSGMLKILTRKGTDEILGATAVGGPAGELIMILSTGMQNGLGLSKIGAPVYPYPGWAEGIKHLADQFNRTQMRPQTQVQDLVKCL